MSFFSRESPPRQETPESSLERLRIKEQWEAQVRTLDKLGILEIFPESKDLGIRGVDGKEYPVPTAEAIEARLAANQELVARKMEQGFTKMLIVPFGYPLDKLVDKYRKAILRHHKEGKLLATKEGPSDPDEPLELNEGEPVYAWSEYQDADRNGKLIYNPQSFKGSHGGKTKAEILQIPESAWQIVLLEDMPNIPRAGRGKTIEGRKQVEAGKSPEEYLELLRKEKAYKGEEGLTPEADLLYALTKLEETNQVANDYQGKGSISYQLGAFFPSSGDVPSSFWSRYLRRAYLDWNGPSHRSVSFGARLAVRV